MADCSVCGKPADNPVFAGWLVMEEGFSWGIFILCQSCAGRYEHGTGLGPTVEMETPVKEELKEVKKVWGKEIIVVNNESYSGKLLHLDRGAECSYHMHPIKKETFYCLEGQVVLTVAGEDYMLNPHSRPKTILPGTFHKFRGVTKAVIIEFATHDDPEDCIRISTSQHGIEMGQGGDVTHDYI